MSDFNCFDDSSSFNKIITVFIFRARILLVRYWKKSNVNLDPLNISRVLIESRNKKTNFPLFVRFVIDSDKSTIDLGLDMNVQLSFLGYFPNFIEMPSMKCNFEISTPFFFKCSLISGYSWLNVMYRPLSL